MEAEELLDLVRNPDKVNVLNRYDLNEIIRKYPAFQAPRLLLYLMDGNEEALQKAALHTTNRWVLQQFRLALHNPDQNISTVLDRMYTEPVNAFEKLTATDTEVEEEQEKEILPPEAISEVQEEAEEPKAPLATSEEGSFFDNLDTQEAEKTAAEEPKAPPTKSEEGSFFDDLDTQEAEKTAAEEPKAPLATSEEGSFFDDIDPDSMPFEETSSSFFDRFEEEEEPKSTEDDEVYPYPEKEEKAIQSEYSHIGKLDEFAGKYGHGHEEAEAEHLPEEADPVLWAAEEFGSMTSIHQTAVAGDVPRPSWERVSTELMPGEDGRDNLPPEVYQVALEPSKSTVEVAQKQPEQQEESKKESTSSDNFFDQF